MDRQEVKTLMYNIDMVRAFADGEDLQQYCGDRWVRTNDPSLNIPNARFRIAPTPKKQYWSKPEDVPFCAWIRFKGNSTASFITSIGATGVEFGGSFLPYRELSKYEYTTDGIRWYECIVK